MIEDGDGDDENNEGNEYAANKISSSSGDGCPSVVLGDVMSLCKAFLLALIKIVMGCRHRFFIEMRQVLCLAWQYRWHFQNDETEPYRDPTLLPSISIPLLSLKGWKNV